MTVSFHLGDDALIRAGGTGSPLAHVPFLTNCEDASAARGLPVTTAPAGSCPPAGAQRQGHFRVNRRAFTAMWNDPSFTTEQIAEAFGLYRTSVTAVGYRLGLPPRKQGRKPKLEREPFATLWLAGVSAQDIADALGITRNHTGTYAKRFGLPKRKQGARGVVSMADFLAVRLRDAMAKTARDEQQAQALAGLRNRPGVKAA